VLCHFLLAQSEPLVWKAWFSAQLVAFLFVAACWATDLFLSPELVNRQANAENWRVFSVENFQ
jgi:hypothetical protein